MTFTPRPTILVLTALPEEHVAIEAILFKPKRLTIGGQGHQRTFTIGRARAAGGGKHTVALVLANMGNNAAGVRVTEALHTFPTITIVLMAGIAAGVPAPDDVTDHVRLGDVVVSDGYGVIDYGFDKQTDEDVTYRPSPRPPGADLLQIAGLLIAGNLAGRRPCEQPLQRILAKLHWVRPPEDTDILLAPNDRGQKRDHPPDPDRRPGQPRVFLGAIGSDNTLQKSARERERLRRQVPH